jgi:lysozyme family protein
MNFDQALAKMLGHEGDYSDHPSDRGGKTRFGITEAVAREVGYRGDMRELPLDLARRIYKERYWGACDALPEAIRFHVFDAAVNSGTGQAAKWLQRACGATEDGIIGPKTLQAVNAMPPLRLVARYSGIRLEFMAGLSTFPAFGRGWARRIASNLKES